MGDKSMENQKQDEKRIYAIIKIMENEDLLVNTTIDILKCNKILKFIKDLIVGVLFYEKLRDGKTPVMQIYTDIEIELKERFNVTLGEESIRKIIRKWK